MVFGPDTYRMFSGFFLSGEEFGDMWTTRMSAMRKVPRSCTPRGRGRHGTGVRPHL